MILTKELLPDKPHQSLCGKCDKCIEHCPTKAIVEPFVIQSDLCIAYHTIETTPKEWIKNLNIESLSWDDKTWKKNLKNTTLKRIKPWMWRRNIKANLAKNK